MRGRFAPGSPSRREARRTCPRSARARRRAAGAAFAERWRWTSRRRGRPGQPPRPRSALILGKEFADLRQKPRAESRTQPEAIYLLHCDSTDTAIARGKDFWMPERALASKPLGAPREWLTDGRVRKRDSNSRASLYPCLSSLPPSDADRGREFESRLSRGQRRFGVVGGRPKVEVGEAQRLAHPARRRERL